jgi:uncharacterized alkaline shock family protein YloU
MLGTPCASVFVQYTAAEAGQMATAQGQGAGGDRESAPLQTEKGTTTITNAVVAKIAGLAAREIDGVQDLKSPDTGGTMSDLATKVTGGDERGSGVKVEVGEREAAIDLGMTVQYEVNIPRLAEAVRQNIMKRVQSMTGLTVTEVNITVSDLFFPEDAQAARRVE